MTPTEYCKAAKKAYRIAVFVALDGRHMGEGIRISKKDALHLLDGRGKQVEKITTAELLDADGERPILLIGGFIKE